MDVSGTTVTISAERLKALEELEKKASTINKYYKSNSERVLKHYEKNRDEINRIRRERYKEKKQAEALAKQAASQP